MTGTRIATGLALGAYFLALLGVGALAARRMKSFRDYITGGGSIPAWMLAVSFMANFVSANSFVGHAAKSYEVGPAFCLVGAFLVAACALSFHVFAPRFADFAREHGTTTLPDFFERRFGSRPLAVLVHWVVVAATLIYILAVVRSTALVAAAGLGLGYPTALGLIYVITVAYCVLGGLWADVFTDVIQSVVLVGGAIALFVAVLVASPDPAAGPPPPLRPMPLGALLAIGLSGSVKLLVDPKQVLVFFAFGDGQAARRFRWLAPLSLLLVLGCLFPVGYLARGLTPAPSEVDALVPTLVFEHHLLGAGFGVLFFIAIFAASMSSLDSALLVVASCLEKHVAAPLARTAPSATRARVLLLAVSTVVLLMSFWPLGGVVELATLSGALLGAALLPTICVGLTRLEVPASAALASVLAGLVGALGGKLLPAALGIRSPWLQDVFVGIAASTLVLIPWLLTRPRAA
ncbi:sodium:solute symporter family protein [Chondromyces apiculatus]|uniref:Sodium:solute symporter family protein n=1 Tax=Chondromyces apiculatus DSM 436 TaxID=1192034 RepID=A0A017SZU6_9BACT|nr:hypothetical protein [Chondromyces apiculatus]EYF02499.1 Hypothetical protein CAP_7121 [Chondromyces apiculatus DSM 436]